MAAANAQITGPDPLVLRACDVMLDHELYELIAPADITAKA